MKIKELFLFDAVCSVVDGVETVAVDVHEERMSVYVHGKWEDKQALIFSDFSVSRDVIVGDLIGRIKDHVARSRTKGTPEYNAINEYLLKKEMERNREQTI